MIHTHSVPLWKRAATAAFLSILAFATTASADYNVDLSWPTDVDNVNYNVSDAQGNYVTSGQPNPADGSCTIQVPDGYTVDLSASYNSVWTWTKQDQVTVNGSDTSLTLTGDIYWFDFPMTEDGVNQPFTISDGNRLCALRDAVAHGYATGFAFVQTADIDMANEPPFEGIGKEDPLYPAPFSGTYNGGGYRIVNITLTDRDGAGIFNWVAGGTIENLTVENVSFEGTTGALRGGAIVGYADQGTTLRNLVAEGNFGTAAVPGTTDMAGIIAYAATDTFVKSCTNNATIHTVQGLLGGICAKTDDALHGSGTEVAFTDCCDKGFLDNHGAALYAVGGIVARVNAKTSLEGCHSDGTFYGTANASPTVRVGAIVGDALNGTLTDLGGNEAPDTVRMVGSRNPNCTVDGFQYATVSAGIATTVVPGLTLVSNTTYLLEGDVPNGTAVHTLANAGDFISFDTALGYSFAGVVDAAPGLAVSGSATGSVLTYSTAPIPTYTVEWKDGNGVTIYTETVQQGATPAYDYTHGIPPKTPTAQYTYTFDYKWYDGAATWNDGALPPAMANVTYEAQFSATVNQYPVTFHDWDGSLLASNTLAYGATPAYPTFAPTPSRPNTPSFTYTFLGWTNSVGLAVNLANETVTGPTTYGAEYQVMEVLYTITFLNWDGSLLDRQQLNYGVQPVYGGITNPPVRPGDRCYTSYGFWDWSEDGTSNSLVRPIPLVVSNATYRAVYTNGVPVKYHLDFLDGFTLGPQGQLVQGGTGTIYQASNWDYGAIPSYTNRNVALYRHSWSRFWYWEFTGNWIYEYDPAFTNAIVNGQSAFNPVLYSNVLHRVEADTKWYAVFKSVPSDEFRRPPYIIPVPDPDPHPPVVPVKPPKWWVWGGRFSSIRFGIGGYDDGEPLDISTTPEATVAVVDGEGTATFQGEWNQPTDWTLVATQGEDSGELTGRFYAKAETEWFCEETLGEVSGFGDNPVSGVAPESATPEGQQVRISMRLDVRASSAPAEAPDPGDARFGIAVLRCADGEGAAFHAYNGSTWVRLYGAIPVDGEADLLLVADMETLDARYYVNGASLWALENDEPVYAIPIGGTAKTLQAVGFSDPDGVVGPVVADYDVPYVAAIGETGYTNATETVAALVAADKADANAVAVELLADGIGGTVALAAGEAVTVLSGTFVSGLAFTAPDGASVETQDVEGGVKYYVASESGDETVTVTFVNDKGDAPAAQTIARGTVATEPQAPVADGFTFTGWFADAATDPFDFATLIDADLTLTAGWMPGGSGDLDPFAIGDNLPDGVKAVEVVGDAFLIRVVVPQGATATILQTSSLQEEFVPLTENVDYTSELGQDGVTTFILPIIPTIRPDFCTIELYKVRFSK